MIRSIEKECSPKLLEIYYKLSKSIRLDVLEMTYQKKAGFIGTSFSCVDLCAVLYGNFLYGDDEPANPDGDVFILSKGHGASAWYATLANTGRFPRERLLSEFNTSGARMGVHPERGNLPGVCVSSGSLGHGLSVGCGLAASKRLRGGKGHVCVLLGDGECNEGSVWEAIMFAHRFKLSNLIAIVDRNRLQSYGTDKEVLDMGELAPKFASFGWRTVSLDGHDHRAIHNALVEAWEECAQPTILIANTVKGKGCSLFENQVLWHYKWPENTHYCQAKRELEDH